MSGKVIYSDKPSIHWPSVFTTTILLRQLAADQPLQQRHNFFRGDELATSARNPGAGETLSKSGAGNRGIEDRQQDHSGLLLLMKMAHLFQEGEQIFRGRIRYWAHGILNNIDKPGGYITGKGDELQEFFDR